MTPSSYIMLLSQTSFLTSSANIDLDMYVCWWDVCVLMGCMGADGEREMARRRWPGVALSKMHDQPSCQHLNLFGGIVLGLTSKTPPAKKGNCDDGLYERLRVSAELGARSPV
ncbi:hypothetical protein BJ878DRAFT_508013, partial [Calycina marina]